GGEDLLKIDSKIENYGSTIVLSEFPDGFIRTGYTFMGWNTANDGSGRMFVSGDKFIVPASNTTLYAQWKINSYTIFFDGNGLNNGRAPASITREFNSILNINSPVGIFTRKGYKFECWNTASDGSGQDFKAGDKLVIGATDQTLFAKWIPITYRVTYRSAYQEFPMFDQFVTGGMILSSPIPKNRPGYIFKGWSISPLKKNVLSFPFAPGVTRNLSLYAVWEKQK
ncbi:MAG: hypothetical protein RJB54_550, partial [Actinomycetota bacterium]